MKWSLKLGRILGIDVYLHLTFLLLLAYVGLSEWAAQWSLQAALVGMSFFAGLFGCVLLHEFGHALMARRYGIRTHDITLLPIGGVARLERMPDKPIEELWVALAGPAVNVAIALVLFLWLWATGQGQPNLALSITQGGVLEGWLTVNLLLVGFNLLPAFPMDGGRVLRALLALRMRSARATQIAARIGQGMAVLFGLFGLWGNPMLLFIAMFVWIGASQEANSAEMKSSFDGLAVREAMLTDFKTLSPEQSLIEAARLILAGGQKDVPVVENGRLVGMLIQTDLLKALQARGQWSRVGEVMRAGVEMAEVDEPLETVLARANSGNGLPVAVLQQGQLVGMMTMDSLGGLFRIRRALAGRTAVQPPPLPAAPPVIAPPVIARREA
jgi:Zn-dependent protease/predicted transcriptional regulator